MQIRELVGKVFNQYFWRYLYCDIRDWFFPRQRWLTKEIPNYWCDKVELIPLTLFKSLEHFVEVEKGFENMLAQIQDAQDRPIEYSDAEDRIATYQEVYDDLKAAYEWGKQRSKFESDTLNMYSADDDKETQKEVLQVICRREEYAEEQTINHMSNIVKHSRYLWT